jgi:SAM-dependent methyltransferase
MTKDDYELDYWLRVKDVDLSGRYKSMVELFNLSEDVGDILDVGCGPRGGILPYVKGNKKVGLDPLIQGYRDNELLSEGIDFVQGTAEEPNITDLFDTIVCANALDHGNSTFQSIKSLSKLLRSGGKLYIHVHLREFEQLNEGHDHLMPLSGFEDVVRETRLTKRWEIIYADDPLEHCYRTLVCCLEKP